MSRKKKISITVGLVLALGIILMILYFSGVLNPTFFKQLTAPKNDAAVKAFTSYEYTEQHQNGSYSRISICKNDDKYYMVQSYKDVGGQYMYLTSPLDDDAVVRWESTLVDFKVADSKDKTDGIYMRSVVTFTTKSGSSNYDVVPLDISGYGAIDPWSNRETIKMVSGISETCNRIFPVSDMKALLQIDNQPQLGAYLNMLGMQFTELLSTDDNTISLSDINSVTLSDITDSTYVLTVDSNVGTTKFVVSKEGYILSSDLDK